MSYAPDRAELIALRGIPVIDRGDDLVVIILGACEQNGIELRQDDILVIAQKIVSKSEGRVVDLASVEPSADAIKRAAETEKDPAVVQLVLDESNEVVRQKNNIIVVEHRLGFVMANAGLDQSNAQSGKAILLPLDPDASAAGIRDGIHDATGCKVGVIVSDSIGRAWRNGTVGHAIGVAGLRSLIDLRETPDLFGRPLKVSEVAIGDEIAAAASALMGQGNEAKPVVIVRGFSEFASDNGTVQDLLRDKERDLFR